MHRRMLHVYLRDNARCQGVTRTVAATNFFRIHNGHTLVFRYALPWFGRFPYINIFTHYLIECYIFLSVFLQSLPLVTKISNTYQQKPARKQSSLMEFRRKVWTATWGTGNGRTLLWENSVMMWNNSIICNFNIDNDQSPVFKTFSEWILFVVNNKWLYRSPPTHPPKF